MLSTHEISAVCERTLPSRGGPTITAGSLVALVTPFRSGQLDTDTFAWLCERQIQHGTAGLVVCGSTGEAAALSTAEQARVVAQAVECSAGRVPVIAGCGASATEGAVHLAAGAVRHGADAVLCAPPPYVKPTQDGIAAHVRAVAQAADAPIILYDVPGRTGIAITDATVATLFQHGLIVAIKDAAGDLSRPPRLRSLCGGELLQFSGDDATAAGHRAMGGDGCISVTANLTPALCAGMQRAWDEGDLTAFGRLRELLSGISQALFVESNPIPIKAALECAGLCDGELRLPLTQATGTTLQTLLALLPGVLEAEADAAGSRRVNLVN